MRFRWYGPRPFKKHCTQQTSKPSWISLQKKEKLHGLEKHHGGIKPILLPHTDTSMSAANACLAGLLSSTTEKAST